MKVENYYYNDFTEENYERLIKIISNKYITISYDYEEIMKCIAEIVKEIVPVAV